MIEAIELKNANNGEYINDFGCQLKYLYNLKRINIFVGENNSGKSRLIRQLLKSNDAQVFQVTNTKKDLNSEFKRLSESLKKSINSFNKANNNSIQLHPNHDNLSFVEMYCYYQDYFDFLDFKNVKYNYPLNNDQDAILRNLEQAKYNILSNSVYGNNTFNSFNKTYIPTLRGIESFHLYYKAGIQAIQELSLTEAQRKALEEYKDNAKKIYHNKISGVYKIKDELIFTGENLYDEIKNKLLGKEQGRREISEFQDFISENFYEREGFTMIPSIDDNVLNIKIGKNIERPLHDFGDGIKQMICILYKLFSIKDKESILFIEEPEINLHPAYQRKLIDLFQCEQFNKVQIFITTHSNHFVDTCFDYDNISIFKFINIGKRNNKFQVINSSPSDIELLDLLGVNNSSVFMANSTIWIEGISDKIYISKYLEVYLESIGRQQDFKENIDYSYVEYGGNLVEHWAFIPDDRIDTINASGITNKAFIILDNDNNPKGKTARKDRLKKIFKSRYYELPVREIENTISEIVLEKTLFKDDEDSKKQKRKYDPDDYKKMHLWEYIEKYYNTDNTYWNSKNIPLRKKDFAKAVYNNIQSIDDLSPTAKTMCSKIVRFLDEKRKITKK